MTRDAGNLARSDRGRYGSSVAEGSAKPRLGELLVGAGLLAQAVLDEVLRTKDANQKLGRALVSRGLVTEQQLTQALSQLLSVPWVSLYHIDFSRALLARVPRELAERFCLVPIFVRNVKGQGETLYVATDDPTNDAALAEVTRVAGLPTRPMIASTSDIQAILRVHYASPDSPPPPAPSIEAPAVTRPEGRRRPAAPTKPGKPVVADPAPDTSAPTRRPATGGRKRTPGVSLTLLDGTKILFPSVPKQDEEGITARDLVSALRARAHGADASEILGSDPKWEGFVSAIVTILLRKGLMTDKELVDELSKV